MSIKPYAPIPVEAARSLADRYSKSVVIVLAWDATAGVLHTTTYGTSPESKEWAATGGEIASRALGAVLDRSVEFEDYRLDQARKLLKVLKAIDATSGFASHVDRQAVRATIAEAETFIAKEPPCPPPAA